MINHSIRHIAFVLLLSSILAVTSCASVQNVSGGIAGQLIWRGTVYVDGDVDVATAATLRIMPGTEVVFLPPRAGQRSEHPFFHGSELIVRGRLIAEGTAQEPIIFRFIDPDAGPGAWGSVNLTESPFASLRYCRFTQADSAIHSQRSGEVHIEQSVFENNHVAIRFHSTSIRIENNLIRRNGTGIRFHFGAPVISQNLIDENDKGIFITAHPHDYRIEYNHFSANNRHVVLGEEVSEDVDMSHNFWNTTQAPAAELFFDGRRSSYLGVVQLDPVLTTPPVTTGPSWIP